jgi:hypothetical protein
VFARLFCATEAPAVMHRIHADTVRCRRFAIAATFAALTAIGIPSSTGCDLATPTPPSEADTTLAAFTKDGAIQVWVDNSGHLTGTLAPWPTFVLELATSCPRLHASVTVNGVDVGLVEDGSGTQISGPAPLFRCALPTFAATIDTSPGASLDIRVWDETKEWDMRVEYVSPTATLQEKDGLRVGTWAHVDLAPPLGYTHLEFAPQGTTDELFSMSSTGGDGGCPSTAIVATPDGAALSTDAGVPCPLSLTDAGLALFVPDVPAGPGQLTIEGWSQTAVTACVGTGYCKLWSNDVQSNPVARIDTSVVR